MSFWGSWLTFEHWNVPLQDELSAPGTKPVPQLQ